jgi:hypothetical protein
MHCTHHWSVRGDVAVVYVVDAANVVGARPDGWWRDRAGAAERLLSALLDAIEQGVSELAGQRIIVVLEGQARAAADRPGIEVVRAEREGDDAIVEVVASLLGSGSEGRDPGEREVVVLTSDRELRERVKSLGATTHGAGWFWRLAGT